MSILRHTAHVLLATPFIVDGINAMTHPAPHAKKAAEAWSAAEDWGAPPISIEKLRAASRVCGAISTGLGIAYIIGPSKRTTATALAVLTVPLAAINAPMWVSGNRHDRKVARRKLVDYGVLFGGLLLGTVDRQGKPSLKWKRAFMKEHKQAIAAARSTVTHAS